MNIPLNIDWQQILLHLLNFFILFAVLYFLLYKPVKSFIDKRQAYYADLDKHANEKLLEAQMLKEEYDGKLSAADEEIAEKKRESEKLIAEENAKQLEAAKIQAENIVEKARADADQEHELIISRANDEISGMVSDAAGKLVFSDTSEAFEAFLNEAEGCDGNE